MVAEPTNMISIYTDIIIVILIAGCFIMGYKQGLVQKLLNFVSIAVSFLVAQFFSITLSGIIFDNVIGVTLIKKIDELATNMQIDSLSIIKNANSMTDNTMQQISKIIKEAVPDFIQPWFETISTNDTVLHSLKGADFSEGATMGSVIVSTIIKPLCIPFLHGILFVLLFIVVGIVLRKMISTLRILNKIPLVGKANQICGGVVGILEVVLLLFVSFTVLDFLLPITGGKLGDFRYSDIMESISYTLYSTVVGRNLNELYLWFKF